MNSEFQLICAMRAIFYSNANILSCVRSVYLDNASTILTFDKKRKKTFSQNNWFHLEKKCHVIFMLSSRDTTNRKWYVCNVKLSGMISDTISAISMTARIKYTTFNLTKFNDITHKQIWWCILNGKRNSSHFFFHM